MSQMIDVNDYSLQGLLLVDKPKSKTSFYLVKLLRSVSKVKKIGHTGTLDPIATGLMLLLIGKNYTTKAPLFLHAKKTYEVQILLGQSTDTYDCQGQTTNSSALVPTISDIFCALEKFQGKQTQIPPMYSAKKVNGKKLYELARKNIQVERDPIEIDLEIELISYQYPLLNLRVTCSSGTYIRTLAHDLGLYLKTFAHITELRRTQNGQYSIDQAICTNTITSKDFNIKNHLLTL